VLIGVQLAPLITAVHYHFYGGPLPFPLTGNECSQGYRRRPLTRAVEFHFGMFGTIGFWVRISAGCPDPAPTIDLATEPDSRKCEAPIPPEI
jgi:hypothetical protein